MSDSVDIARDVRPVNESSREVAPEDPSNNQLPSLGRLNGTSSSYSDAASIYSENSISSRRRHQRGGRRKKEKGDRQQPFSEPERSKPSQHEETQLDIESTGSVPHPENGKEDTISSRRRHQRGRRRRKQKGDRRQPFSEPECSKPSQHEETQLDIESTGSVPHPENGDEEELRKVRSSRTSEADREQSPRKKYETATGIRAFNIKKAKSSGGRPVGITIERPKSTGESSGKGKGKKGKKSNGAVEGDLEEEGEEQDEEADTETETRNPVSIRLDIDLEVEVFLRAKIQGVVTITFL
jgi:hypothetical protein